MVDKVIEEKKEEGKEEEKPKKQTYADFHKKSMRQIVLEAKQEELKTPKEEPKEDKEDEKVVTPPVEEGKEEEKPVKEEKREIDEEIIKKAKEEAKQEAKVEAERITTEKLEAQKKEFQGKIDEILNKDKAIEDKQKEADALVAVWEKENRLPKDWKEIASEQLRISNERLEQRLKEQEEKRAKAEEERKQQEEKVKLDQKRSEDERLATFQKQIADELEELYNGNFLKRPTKAEEINNEATTDEAAKETQAVFKFGVELNTERQKKGLPAVTSLSKIYFMHYKPFVEASGKKDNQPAGADAPVSGAKATPKKEAGQGNFYQQVHNSSYRQILQRGLSKKN